MMPILLYSCENWLAIETVGVISGRDREEDSGSAKVYIQYSIGYGNGLAFDASEGVDGEAEFLKGWCWEMEQAWFQGMLRSLATCSTDR